jgi:hypothetical protein
LKVTIIGNHQKITQYQHHFTRNDFHSQFLFTDDIRKSSTSFDSVIVILPWNGYRKDIEANFCLLERLESRSVIVLGSMASFYEIEDLVIRGCISFLAEQVSDSVLNATVREILRIHERVDS